MGGQMLKSLTSAYDNGVKLSDNELALAKVNFKQSLNKGGTGDLLSTAFDDIMGMGTPLLDQGQYANQIAAIRGDDPAAKMQAEKELKLAIEDAYTGKLTEQANAGFANKEKDDKKEGGTETSSQKIKRIKIEKRKKLLSQNAGTVPSYSDENIIAKYNEETGKYLIVDKDNNVSKVHDGFYEADSEELLNILNF